MKQPGNADRTKINTQRSNEKGPQRELLALLLEEGPVRLTLSELQARLGGPAGIKRAVEILIAADLVTREGDEVVPTLAATRFYELIPAGRTWAG